MNVARPIAPVTLEEFERMDKDERMNYELIDGVVMMAPSPSEAHQNISGNIYYQSRLILKSHSGICKPLFELELKTAEDVLKPDVLIKCKNEEIPRIVFEVIRPTSKYRDLVIKVQKYKEIGVHEYWIIDADAHDVTVHDYIKGETVTYTMGNTVCSSAVEGILYCCGKYF